MFRRCEKKKMLELLNNNNCIHFATGLSAKSFLENYVKKKKKKRVIICIRTICHLQEDKKKFKRKKGKKKTLKMIIVRKSRAVHENGRKNKTAQMCNVVKFSDALNWVCRLYSSCGLWKISLRFIVLQFMGQFIMRLSVKILFFFVFFLLRLIQTRETLKVVKSLFIHSLEREGCILPIYFEATIDIYDNGMPYEFSTIVMLAVNEKLYISSRICAFVNLQCLQRSGVTKYAFTKLWVYFLSDSLLVDSAA